jgi:VWFA-related protein
MTLAAAARMGVVLAGVALFAAALHAQRFRSGVDAVRVDVLVTRNGRPVANLAPGDFELLDTGVPQRIDTVTIEDLPLNVLLLFDASVSLAGTPLARLKEAAGAAVESLRAGDSAALLTFSHAVQLRTSWTTDRGALHQAIGGIEAGGLTSLNDAISVAVGLRDGIAGRALVLLFSDGLDSASWLSPADALDQVKRSDVVFYTVSRAAPGIGGDIVPDRLSGAPRDRLRRWFAEEPHLFRQELIPALADISGGRALSASDDRLARVFVSIVGEFKRRYLITYSPENVPPGGWHPIEVRLRGKPGEVTARRGYLR